MGIHNVYMLEFAENYIVGSFSFYSINRKICSFKKSTISSLRVFFNMEFLTLWIFFFYYYLLLFFFHFNFTSLPCNYVNDNTSHYTKWIYSIRMKSLSISLANLVIIKLGTLHKLWWSVSKLNHSYLQI